MKKRLILFAVIIPAMAFAQVKKTNLSVTGQIKNSKDTIAWVFVSYAAGDKRVTDSSKVTGNKYGFNLNIPAPVLASFRVKKAGTTPKQLTRNDFASIFLEPGKIDIANIDSFSNTKVTGSKSHVEYLKLEEQLKPYNDQLDKLYTLYTSYRKAKDEANLKITEAAIDSIDEKTRVNVYGSYAKSKPGSPIALYTLQQYAGYEALDVAAIEPLFNKLNENIRNSANGIAFKNRIELARKLDIGKPALDFTQKDTLGNSITLASFKGKYVLVDFWASWCGPCRAENPNMVKAFNEFKDKGFTILSVSLDQPGAREKWLKAIHDDHLTWTHVSDLQFWDNAVAKLYGIQSIPSNFLLDPQGKIIAKNLRGEDLAGKLKQLL